ncbi:hypothetical protein [Mesorhizobium sp. M0998]|uniref:hypothetical protein n=1 Tax=Mesorhizobium sp. M0998 TaxID=2957044 RepID=UPI003338F501
MGVIVRNLYFVDGRAKFRKVIPERLRPHIDGNITEFVRWLGRGGKADPAILSKCAEAAEECGRLIAIAKKRLEGRFDDLSAEMIAHIISCERSNMLQQDEEDRFDGEAEAVFEAVREQLKQVPGTVINIDPDRRWNNRQEALEAFLADCRHHYARGNIPTSLHWEIEQLCAAHGLHVEVGGLSFRRLGKAYLAMLIEVSEAQLKRQNGEIVPTPDPSAPPIDTAEADRGLTLREMAEKKLAMKKKGYSTTEATETALRLFESVYDEHRAMTSVTRREVAEWIFLLQQRPKQPEKQHRALGLREMVEVYKDRPDVQRITGKSVNGHVSHLNSIWTWARQRGYVERSLDNPFGEQRVEEVAPEADEGFTPAQLQAIFRLPVFTAGERPKGGRGEAAFWLPLLLLFYGTRPEEMCQLLVSDVFQDEDEGIWCLRITDEGDHPVKGSRSIKADGNPLVRRTLPVARILLDLGFTDYVEHLRRSGEQALFPKLTVKGKRGYLHASFATWWGGYARSHGAIPEHGNKPLRGFRDTWTTAASRSGLTEEEREWIQGHYVGKGKTSNRRYGIRDFGRKIDEVTFKGLDLSGLLAPS